MNSPLRLLACAVLLFTAATASAQTVINASFGGAYTGKNALPDSTDSDVWSPWDAANGPTNGEWESGPLLDTAGNLTSISAIASSTTGEIWRGGITGNAVPLFDSYWHLNGLGELTLTIQNLERFTTYDLYVYGARRTDDPGIPIGPSTGEFNIGVNALSTTYDGTADSFQENINYVHFNVLTDEGGEIVLHTTSIINGFTLVTPAATAVPEPSTYAIVAGVAALGLAIQYRRRKTA